MGIGFLGIGFQPKWGLKDIPIMPKVLLNPLSAILRSKNASFGEIRK